MNGCVGGRWVMGTPYKQVASLSYLPPTIVYGAFKQNVYDQIAPIKISMNETVTTTPAECATIVQGEEALLPSPHDTRRLLFKVAFLDNCALEGPRRQA